MAGKLKVKAKIFINYGLLTSCEQLELQGVSRHEEQWTGNEVEMVVF
jgi:hypothetical protein